MKKKAHQLGMNPSTASHRLVKDLLFRFVILAGHKCHRCGEELNRADFSIDHKVPWRNSDNPIGLFFDLDNIAFSHLSCNVSVGQVWNKKYATKAELQEARREQTTRWSREHYTPERRRAQYLRTGK